MGWGVPVGWGACSLPVTTEFFATCRPGGRVNRRVANFSAVSSHCCPNGCRAAASVTPVAGSPQSLDTRPVVGLTQEIPPESRPSVDYFGTASRPRSGRRLGSPELATSDAGDRGRCALLPLQEGRYWCGEAPAPVPRYFFAFAVARTRAVLCITPAVSQKRVKAGQGGPEWTYFGQIAGAVRARGWEEAGTGGQLRRSRRGRGRVAATPALIRARAVAGGWDLLS